MPFTAAHPLAVWPLVRWRRALHLDATCLVIGSMAPDLEYFVLARLEGRFGHSLLGLFAWCLPMTLILAALYHALLKWPWLMIAPAWITARAATAAGEPWRVPSSAGTAISYAMSALIGAGSHLVWDSFTHVRGWSVRHLPFLMTPVPFPVLGRDPLARVLQHVSSVVGLAVLASLAARWLRRQPAIALPALDRRRARWLFAICVAAWVTVLVARILADPYAEIGDLVVAPISGVIAGSILASVILRADAARLAQQIRATVAA